MKKYYVIRLALDNGFWNEEKQDFVGWNYATKYEQNPTEIQEKFSMGNGIIGVNVAVELKKASSKKPVIICEIYENE